MQSFDNAHHCLVHKTNRFIMDGNRLNSSEVVFKPARLLDYHGSSHGGGSIRGQFNPNFCASQILLFPEKIVLNI